MHAAASSKYLKFGGLLAAASFVFAFKVENLFNGAHQGVDVTRMSRSVDQRAHFRCQMPFQLLLKLGHALLQHVLQPLDGGSRWVRPLSCSSAAGLALSCAEHQPPFLASMESVFVHANGVGNLLTLSWSCS